MKILCVSDQIDPLVYSPAVKERFSDVDMVLSAGDLPMEYLDFIVSTMNKPTCFVFGNHNLQEFKYYHNVNSSMSLDRIDLSHAHGAEYAGFKVLKMNNMLIAGVSGSLRYNNGENQYTDGEMKWKLIKMIPALIFNKIRYGRYLDIFLTHAPPLGIHDKPDLCHKGFSCYKWFLKKFRPRYMIHGHIHLYDIKEPRVSVYESTTIINAFSHYVLDTDK